jgi:hypothetical protein
MKSICRIVAMLFASVIALAVSSCAGSGSANVPVSNESATRSLESSSGPVHNFRFIAVSHNPVSGDNIVIAGDGRFGPNQALGSGSYTQWHVVGSAPFPVTASGTWHVTQFVSFTPNGTFGAIMSGVLTIKINLLQATPSRTVIPATATVYCNIGPGNLFVGHPEGVKLVEPSATFDTLVGATNATNFSAGPE